MLSPVRLFEVIISHLGLDLACAKRRCSQVLSDGYGSEVPIEDTRTRLVLRDRCVAMNAVGQTLEGFMVRSNPRIIDIGREKSK